MTAQSRPGRALDHAFRVHTDVDELAGWVTATFAGLADPGPAEVAEYAVLHDGDGYACWAGDTRLTRTRTLGRSVEALLYRLNADVVAASHSGRVMLHAAGAQWESTCVLLPAASGRGKSTTVAGLMRAGFDYLTDEVVGIDLAKGTVQGWRKALAVGRGSWPLLPELAPAHRPVRNQWQVPPHPERFAPAPLRVDLIVSPSYEYGATTELVPMSPGEALLLLAQSAFGFPERSDVHLPALAEIARRAPAFRLRLGDLPDGVARVRSLVDQLGLGAA